MDWAPEDLSAEQRQEVCDHYKRHMIYGALWCGGGLAVTVLTFSGGRGGLLCYGAIIWGLIDFCRGFNGYLTYK